MIDLAVGKSISNLFRNGRFGSLIIDYEIIGSLNKSVNFTTDLAKCMTDLLHGKIKLMVLQHIPTILHMTIKDQSGLPQYSKKLSSIFAIVAYI